MSPESLLLREKICQTRSKKIASCTYMEQENEDDSESGRHSTLESLAIASSNAETQPNNGSELEITAKRSEVATILQSIASATYPAQDSLVVESVSEPASSILHMATISSLYGACERSASLVPQFEAFNSCRQELQRSLDNLEQRESIMACYMRLTSEFKELSERIQALHVYIKTLEGELF